MILLYDNYDSFTYNLYDYLQQNGADCMVIRNDERSVEDIEQLNISGIVLSPGPCRPADSGNMMQVIEKFHHKVPLLGICLGHQAIGEFFGAKLVKADQPMHGKTSLISHTGHAMFADIPEQFEVMRYHSLVLKNIPVPLQITAQSSDQEVMALAHRELPVWGMQFHPESILTEFGLILINNWLELI
jgi:anthranilate synthase/aminodeoxychorismate synthase-like glutamine amidotransferase